MSSEPDDSNDLSVTKKIHERKKTRELGPDHAYVVLLNSYINTFFSLDYLEAASHPADHLTLSPSKVTVLRAYYGRDPGDEEESLENTTFVSDSEQGDGQNGLNGDGPIHPQFNHTNSIDVHGQVNGAHDDFSNGSARLGNGYYETLPEEAEFVAEITPETSSSHSAPPHGSNHHLDDLPGSLWTSDEKETFFRCLSRYSIHNIDAFAPHLPTKSIAEISQYHTLLKVELRRLETYKQHDVAFRDVDTPRRKVPFCYVSKTFEDGASYSEIPIAFELSQQWIDYEEDQSSRLCGREYNLELTQEKLRRKNMVAKYGHSVGGVQDSYEYGLLNTRGLLSLQKMYRASKYAQDVGNTPARVFRFDAMVFYEELIRQRVKDILATLVVNRGLEGAFFGDPEFDFSENQELKKEFALDPRTAVTRVDIYKAIESLKMFEAPAMGFHSKNRNGKTPVMDTYWTHVRKSLGLNVDVKGPLFAEGVNGKYYKKHINEYEDTDPFLDGDEKAEWDYDGEMVDFSARGYYEGEEVGEEELDELEEEGEELEEPEALEEFKEELEEELEAESEEELEAESEGENSLIKEEEDGLEVEREPDVSEESEEREGEENEEIKEEAVEDEEEDGEEQEEIKEEEVEEVEEVGVSVEEQVEEGEVDAEKEVEVEENEEVEAEVEAEVEEVQLHSASAIDDHFEFDHPLQSSLPPVQSLPTNAPTKKILEDALVEELLFLKETKTLEASDAKRDALLHSLETRRVEIKRRKLEPLVFEESPKPPFFEDMWGNTDMDNFCDATLRRSWDHSFARY